MSNDVEDKARRGNAFKIAACDYLAQRIQPQGARAPLSETTMTKAERMLESFVYPHIADLSLHLYPRWQHQRGQPGMKSNGSSTSGWPTSICAELRSHSPRAARESSDRPPGETVRGGASNPQTADSCSTPSRASAATSDARCNEIRCRTRKNGSSTTTPRPSTVLPR